MQNDQTPIIKNEEFTLSPRTQQLISHLETLWQRPYQPSPEMFKRISEFLSQLPDSYQALGFTKIADYFTSSMGLHFMDLMAKFQQNAQLEDMDKEEIAATIEGDITELYQEMMDGVTYSSCRSSYKDFCPLISSYA